MIYYYSFLLALVAITSSFAQSRTDGDNSPIQIPPHLIGMPNPFEQREDSRRFNPELIGMPFELPEEFPAMPEGFPGFPGMPEEFPGMPERFPGIPEGFPELPGMPEIFPELPGMPEGFPGFPGFPGIPSMPETFPHFPPGPFPSEPRDEFMHGSNSHWRDACFCLGFNPDVHREAAECLFSILSSAEEYLSNNHGELINHIYNARVLLEDYLVDDSVQEDLSADLYDVTCDGDSVEGLVLITNMQTGRTGTLCDDTFDMDNVGADLLCRELGFGHGEYTRSGSYDAPFDIVLDNLQCYGAASLRDCDHETFDQHNCERSEAVNIRCYNYMFGDYYQCHDYNYNTYSGDNYYYNGYSSDNYYYNTYSSDYYNGYPVQTPQEYIHLTLGDITCEHGAVVGLLMAQQGDDVTTKGSVCDDSFGIVEADVACRYLGYDYGENLTSGNTSRNVYYPVVLDEVVCTNPLMPFNECSRNPFGQHDCSHSEDVIVKCYFSSPDRYEFDNINNMAVHC